MSTIIVNIRGGVVSISPRPVALAVSSIIKHRTELYRDFIQKVVDKHKLNVETSFAFCLADETDTGAKAPVFGFQKLAGSDVILFPDVDFLNSDFYCGDQYADLCDFHSKSTSAIFVGSTTGARHTEQSVRGLTAPRLRAAANFKHSTMVKFLLPEIVQCDCDRTALVLREMGFGDGVRVDLKDQMKHKFLISMDGNGAACSRVVVALKSNSVLLKYASEHQLYYFSHLIPWRHYIPIRADREVEDIVRMELDLPGRFHFIAVEGREFAEKYLGRRAVAQYAAEVIRLFADLFVSTKPSGLGTSSGVLLG